MNVKLRILKELYKNGYESQRVLADRCEASLGSVNQHLKQLMDEGAVSSDYQVIESEMKDYKFHQPQRAIILAAGTGLRMLPINNEVPKALLEVNQKPLIETTIEDLQAVGVKEIYVVVGYLKEMFDYLVDQYGVKLIYNGKYLETNNFYSLKLASNYLEDCYIIPGDLYFHTNVFSEVELNSWYMVGVEEKSDADFKVMKNDKLMRMGTKGKGNRNVGIAYMTKNEASGLKEYLNSSSNMEIHHKDFWEEALLSGDTMKILAKTCTKDEVYEINTFQELRELDQDSTHLNAKAIQAAAQALGVLPHDIENVSLLKKGMTNRSFIFETKGREYIMRVPGEGTDQLINRKEEADVYKVISDYHISDEIIYIDPTSGYKIAHYWDDIRCCDPESVDDVRRSMIALKKFHDLKLTVDHEFDAFERIEYYETLWTMDTLFKDYQKTKERVMGLKPAIDGAEKDHILCHIDSVPDNFLFRGDEIKLIDWEYAAMQDPHMDIAMFAIYSLYERDQVDELIKAYFQGPCSDKIRFKVYAYIAMCGLTWSNWCEFKRMHGVEFGEYSLRQYRYAKDYTKLVEDYLSSGGEL